MKTVSAALAAIAAVVLLFTSASTAQGKNPPAPSQAHTSGATARSQTTPAPATPGTFEYRVEEFIRESGFKFQKVKANSWYLMTPGTEMAQIRVILGAGPNAIAMGAVVVPKRNLRLTTDALQQLMKLSYDLNYVRVCIDTDDDLIVMGQLKDPWLNAAEFKNMVNLVTAAADGAYKVMRAHLSAP